jgi:hypothetical protein
MAELKAQIRDRLPYDVQAAMHEIDIGISFALQHKNAMAAAKLMESKMKLSGLLVERVAVDHTVGLNLVRQWIKRGSARARLSTSATRKSFRLPRSITLNPSARASTLT